ncbi:MAG: cyclopropane fatty acyl phospholipid synthase [Chromatiales bacterium]|nr:cyclopropane fatty acyl phospholipid synthase [Chromatiales bacterium]
MLNTILKRKYQILLEKADIKINGDRPWDIQVHNEALYKRVSLQGSLGFGESYMEGWWECESIEEMIRRVMQSKVYDNAKSLPHLYDFFIALLLNLQKIKRAFQVGKQHYDLSYDLFKSMLDKRMIYSCGYWKMADDLDAAQEAKLKLIFDKLLLEPGMQLLDIGCGWGGAAKYAAEHYGVSVTGITISKEQQLYAINNCRGLPIEIRLQDYRTLQQKYDRIYSIGMFEHVGYKNHSTYLKTVRNILAPQGLSVLHTIGSSRTQYVTDPWIAKYIFPNSLIPSAKQITTACENLFVIEDWQNLGLDYAKTLLAWFRNFDEHWEKFKHDYDERFYRMWKYYLLSCAGAFLARNLHTWQIVLSPNGTRECYRAPR